MFHFNNKINKNIDVLMIIEYFQNLKQWESILKLPNLVKI